MFYSRFLQIRKANSIRYPPIQKLFHCILSWGIFQQNFICFLLYLQTTCINTSTPKMVSHLRINASTHNTFGFFFSLNLIILKSRHNYQRFNFFSTTCMCKVHMYAGPFTRLSIMQDTSNN